MQQHADHAAERTAGRNATSGEQTAGRTPVAVVGAGPAGLTAAVAVAAFGVPATLIGPRHFPAAGAVLDTRTSALMAGAVRLLRTLGAWEACGPRSAPLWSIRMIDDTGRLLRAPDIVFHATEIGSEPFAWNVPNDALVAALEARAAALPALTRIDGTTVAGVSPGPDCVELRLADGRRIESQLVVAADGRSSPCRAAAGIRTLTWRYDQVALACNLTHSAPHGGTSTELHREAGPCTVVPLPDPVGEVARLPGVGGGGESRPLQFVAPPTPTLPRNGGGSAAGPHASSLVWVERPDAAARLAALPDDGFRRELQQRLGTLLGRIETVGPRATFPLSGLSARELAARRIALVGEAAHVVPPIGAQGLNLGFRDAAAVADIAAKAVTDGRDPGADDVLAGYAAARRADIVSRTLAVDLLNRSLISGLLPFQLLRGAGLHLLNAVPPLRRLAMREGMQPGLDLPALMR